LGAPTALADLFSAAARFCCRQASLWTCPFWSAQSRPTGAPAHIYLALPTTQREEIMGHLVLQGDNTNYPGFSLLGEPSLAITFDEIGVGHFNQLDFLVLSGTTSVSITSKGAASGDNVLNQLAETSNDLTTVTISGLEPLRLGVDTGHSNSGDGGVTDIAATASSPTTIHSSLTVIDASATTGTVEILAGATNTSGGGNFQNGGSLNANVAITYTGLTIKGGSGDDLIENDAKNGIVTVGNGHDTVTLGGPGAKATLGTHAGDRASVGFSVLGTNETAGSALGDTVKFGNAAADELFVGPGAEPGSTAGTTSIGLTKVLNAAAGMQISFHGITISSMIVDETLAVASSTSLPTAENAAVKAMGSSGIAYFKFHSNEYFIATNNVEAAVSSNDAIVELVGVTNIHHAINSLGVVTLMV
jgi:hypothetical protein